MEERKIEQWVKIGEVVRSSKMFANGIYARYAVMEFIETNGMRKYKEIRICTWTQSENVKAQPELD